MEQKKNKYQSFEKLRNGRAEAGRFGLRIPEKYEEKGHTGTT